MECHHAIVRVVYTNGRRDDGVPRLYKGTVDVSKKSICFGRFFLIPFLKSIRTMTTPRLATITSLQMKFPGENDKSVFHVKHRGIFFFIFFVIVHLSCSKK